MSLGTNISRLRAEKRLSQGDLAEVLEVSRQSVSKWETDSSVPDLDKLIKLSQLFRVTLDELVTGAEPQLKVETPPVMVSPSMPGRKIAGIILFCMAFLAFLIPTVLGGILVGLILAVPFLVCGIICFLVRKRPGQELLQNGDLCRLLVGKVLAALRRIDRCGVGTLLGEFGDDFHHVGVGQFGNAGTGGLGFDDVFLDVAQGGQTHCIAALHGLHDSA